MPDSLFYLFPVGTIAVSRYTEKVKFVKYSTFGLLWWHLRMSWEIWLYKRKSNWHKTFRVLHNFGWELNKSSRQLVICQIYISVCGQSKSKARHWCDFDLGEHLLRDMFLLEINIGYAKVCSTSKYIFKIR